jgi:DeoR/GlpR family transcriptional regulator of sugar metabolism
MLTRQRKQHILSVLQRDGQVVAKELSAQLSLSEDTIRRDLREMAQQGILQRVHGGALPASQAMSDFAARQELVPDEKKAIARAAAGLIQRGQVIFIDGGTTAVQLARSLSPDLRATVITHSPSVAVELATHASVDVVLIGGRLFKHSIVSVGAMAFDGISRVRADIYFMGVTGIHPKAGLSTGDLEEAGIKHAIMSASAETVVLASSEKLGVASPYVVAPITEISTLVVSSTASTASVAPYRKAGIRILRAGARRN